MSTNYMNASKLKNVNKNLNKTTTQVFIYTHIKTRKRYKQYKTDKQQDIQSKQKKYKQNPII